VRWIITPDYQAMWTLGAGEKLSTMEGKRSAQSQPAAREAANPRAVSANHLTVAVMA
jgi:hypothetical protein